MSGHESIRIVFRGEGHEAHREYKLDGLRAKTFLRSLQSKGLWEPEAETARAIGR
jgi:hypothetical protein